MFKKIGLATVALCVGTAVADEHNHLVSLPLMHRHQRYESSCATSTALHFFSSSFLAFANTSNAVPGGLYNTTFGVCNCSNVEIDL